MRLTKTYNKDPWYYLGSGNYNDVYVDEGGRKVFKIQKKKHALESDEEFEELLAMDKKERSVRLWNQICGVGEAEEYEDGWTAPYIDGNDASEMDIAHALVDIYERTGRIVVDAAVRGNFKK